MDAPKSIQLIAIPEFLNDTSGEQARAAAACAWCSEIACESASMICGQCSGQTCAAQCNASQCSTEQCGTCEKAQCGSRQCGTCERCQSNQCGICEKCQTGQCALCEGCQYSEGCYSVCEITGEEPKPTASGTITITGTSATSIAIRLSPIAYATSYVIVYRPSSTTTSIKLPAITSLTHTIGGLEANTEYVINYYGQNDYGTGPYMESGVTARTKSSIELWSWTSSNGSASSAQTVAAYQAMMNEGVSNEFSYAVWNDLVSKINTVVVAVGASWDNSFATLSGAKLSGAGQTLTAGKYNAARFNIGSHYSTGIAEVHSGDEFTWSYIFRLAAKLNEWIGSL